MRVLPCGERAFLVQLADLGAVLALDARVRARFGAGGPVEDVVPAARTLLVVARAASELAGVRAAVAGLLADAGAAPAASEGVVEIAVRYDGPDLADVARLTGLSPAEVVAAHTGTPWRVGFGGFAPGFAYLVDGDPRLEVPRRPSPRTAVPAGAVGLAGTFSGVYPRSSPGGWQLIGRTDAVLWDPHRTPPALLRPGAWVRFVSVPDLANSRVRAMAREPALEFGARGARTLAVLAPGPLALVQDLGRPGHAHLGVGRSGAFDRAAAAFANRLVGNDPDAALLESLGGLAVRLTGSAVLATAGAPAPVTVNGRPAPHGQRLYLTDGDELRLGTPTLGLRTYLAASGGLAVPATLGSRASDTLAHLGPARLVAGDVLPLGAQPDVPTLAPDLPGGWPTGEALVLDLLPGPRDAWVDLDALSDRPWVVASASDRIGVRLEGTPLARAAGVADAELPTEGTVRGAVQVPPSGLPVVFGPDHPVTGGYPVVAVLTEASSDALAQARPGQLVRFRRVSRGGHPRTRPGAPRPRHP